MADQNYSSFYHWMTKLLTKNLYQQLKNKHKQDSIEQVNFLNVKPIVKLFTPDANATWLLVSLDDDNIAFGLCDLGLGFPELGYVSLRELMTIRGKFGLPIERDQYFKADKTLEEYIQEAQRQQCIEA